MNDATLNAAPRREHYSMFVVKAHGDVRLAVLMLDDSLTWVMLAAARRSAERGIVRAPTDRGPENTPLGVAETIPPARP